MLKRHGKANASLSEACSEKRVLTNGYSEVCKSRKVKCDGANPCSKCLERKQECVYYKATAAIPTISDDMLESMADSLEKRIVERLTERRKPQESAAIHSVLRSHPAEEDYLQDIVLPSDQHPEFCLPRTGGDGDKRNDNQGTGA